MSSEYNHKSHNKHLLQVHLIFVTKYRKKLLLGKIAEDIKLIIFGLCTLNDWEVVTQETDKDHIHMLISYNPITSVTKLVTTLKQQSTYKVWKIHKDYLLKHFWKQQIFWSPSYFACSIGNVSQETIKKYIAEQG